MVECWRVVDESMNCGVDKLTDWCASRLVDGKLRMGGVMTDEKTDIGTEKSGYWY